MSADEKKDISLLDAYIFSGLSDEPKQNIVVSDTKLRIWIVCLYAYVFCYHSLAFECQVVASGRKDVAERAGKFFSGSSNIVYLLTNIFFLVIILWYWNFKLSDIPGLDKTIYFVEGEFGCSRLLSFSWK